MQNDALFYPLAKGIRPLKGKYAYSHVNALNSAIQAYYQPVNKNIFSQPKNVFYFILRQSCATGGWSPNEELVELRIANQPELIEQRNDYPFANTSNIVINTPKPF